MFIAFSSLSCAEFDLISVYEDEELEQVIDVSLSLSEVLHRPAAQASAGGSDRRGRSEVKGHLRLQRWVSRHRRRLGEPV